jgi:hypothetical protein
MAIGAEPLKEEDDLVGTKNTAIKTPQVNEEDEEFEIDWRTP